MSSSAVNTEISSSLRFPLSAGATQGVCSRAPPPEAGLNALPAAAGSLGAQESREGGSWAGRKGLGRGRTCGRGIALAQTRWVTSSEPWKSFPLPSAQEPIEMSEKLSATLRNCANPQSCVTTVNNASHGPNTAPGVKHVTQPNNQLCSCPGQVCQPGPCTAQKGSNSAALQPHFAVCPSASHLISLCSSFFL